MSWLPVTKTLYHWTLLSKYWCISVVFLKDMTYMNDDYILNWGRHSCMNDFYYSWVEIWKTILLDFTYQVLVNQGSTSGYDSYGWWIHCDAWRTSIAPWGGIWTPLLLDLTQQVLIIHCSISVITCGWWLHI